MQGLHSSGAGGHWWRACRGTPAEERADRSGASSMDGMDASGSCSCSCSPRPPPPSPPPVAPLLCSGRSPGSGHCRTRGRGETPRAKAHTHSRQHALMVPPMRVEAPGTPDSHRAVGSAPGSPARQGEAAAQRHNNAVRQAITPGARVGPQRTAPGNPCGGLALVAHETAMMQARVHCALAMVPTQRAAPWPRPRPARRWA